MARKTHSDLVPKVSIGLPVYNGEKYLGAAVDSILSQDFEDFDLVLCDNASTDRTAEICQAYAARDKRVRYVRNATNIGAAPNHNRVVELATGQYFKWAAHDDVSKPGLLKRCVEVLEQAPPSVALVYPRFEIIDDDGNLIGDHEGVSSIETRAERPHRRVSHVLRRIGMGTAMYGLMRIETVRKTRRIASFDRSDYVLLAELSMLGELWEIPETLLSRRLHAGHSAAIHPTVKAINAWYNPTANGDRLPQRERLAVEYARSAFRLPIATTDKLMCLVTAPSVHYFTSVLQAVRRVKQKLEGTAA